MLDPDVHIHEWLKGHVPLGITVPVPPGGVFPVVSPQSVGREQDRIRYLHAKVWGAENYASYEDPHGAQADKRTEGEISTQGMFRWDAPFKTVAHRMVASLERQKEVLAVTVAILGDERHVQLLIHDMPEPRGHQLQSVLLTDGSFDSQESRTSWEVV